jgi:hypothetical protein
MSESNSCIPQKVAALAEALEAVRAHIDLKNGSTWSKLEASVCSWLRALGPDPMPWDGTPEDARKEVLAVAADFVDAVDTAQRRLNAVPVIVLKPLSTFTDGVRWDVRTRRTLKEIEASISILRYCSTKPDFLLSVLRIGSILNRMQQELRKSLNELSDRIFDLQCLPDADPTDPTDAIISQRRTHQEPLANPNENTQSDGGSVLPSSKTENPTKTDNNFVAALAREQLRPYVKIPEFRQYVKEQITQWELWHRSHTEQINEHEGLRDNLHQELKELQGRDLRHSDDPADVDPLGCAETCYEGHRDVAAWLKDDPEYKLVADREPVLFKEASVASIVALFWCDVNDSTLLVPKYDFLGPKRPFIGYLREQWEKPIHGRYKHIDWFVQAAVEAYERKGPVAPQAEESVDTADEMQEALTPTESSHPVPERTTLKQPSGSGNADAEAKLTPTVGHEAVEPETTESTTTEQKKPVIESEENKKIQSKDDLHRTTQKSQSETVQLTEELKVVAFLTDGVGSEVVEKVASIVRSSKSLEDKLHQVDQIIKLPAKSSRKLGTMFGVSHTAIQRTGWWKKNHKSREDRFAEREARLKERGKRSGLLPNDDE